MTRKDSVKLIRWFDEMGLADIPKVGAKSASRGALSRALGGQIKVPEGFAIAVDACRRFVAADGLWARLEKILGDTDWADAAATPASASMQRMVREAPLPEGPEDAVRAAYARLEHHFGRCVAVAVRSSATAEDSPNASFAGVHESFLDIRGLGPLLIAVRDCFASLFTQRAVSYRIGRGFDQRAVALSVGVQRMIRANRAASGAVALRYLRPGAVRPASFRPMAGGAGDRRHEPQSRQRARCDATVVR